MIVRRRAVTLLASAVLAVAGSWLLTSCDPPEPCTANWVGGTTGNWSDGANWDIGEAPHPADRACTPATVTVTVDTTTSVDSAKLKGTVEIPTGNALSLQSDGPLSQIGHLELTGGTIGGSGIVEVNQLTWTGGTMTGSGRTDVLAGHTTTVSGDVRIDSGRELYVRNHVDWTGGTFAMCDDSLVGIWGSMSWSAAGGTIGTSGCSGPSAPRIGVIGSLDVTADATAALKLYNFADVKLDDGVSLATDFYEQDPNGVPSTDLGDGAVLKVDGGSGTAALNGGLLTGTGTVDGDLTGAGTVSPGDPVSLSTIGKLSVTGSYTPAAGADLTATIAGPTAGTEHDQLAVGGTATLDDLALTTTVDGDYTPTDGDTVDVVTAAAVSGTFASAPLPAGVGTDWELTYAPTSASLVANDVAVGSDHNPSIELRPGTITATIGFTGTAPTGSVAFDDGGTGIGSDTLDSSGEASIPIGTLGVGSHQITATYAGDGTHGATTATYTQVVSAESGPPTAADDDYNATEDTDLVVPAGTGLLANDTGAPGYPLSVVAASVTDPAHGDVLVSSDGSFTYTPDTDYAGDDTFSYKANDGSADSNAATVTIHVAAVNDNPTDISLTNNSINENDVIGATIGSLSATDPDPGDTHTFTLQSSGCSGSFPDNSAFSITGSSLKAGISFNYEVKNSYSICVRATDNGTPNLSFDEVLTVDIVDRNDAPVADDESFSGTSRAIGNTAFVVDDPTDAAPDPTGPQKTVTGDILAGDTDEDGTGSLAVVAGTFATTDGGSVTIEADGDFTFFPKVGTSCTDHDDSFDYTVTDQNSTTPPGTALTDTGTVSINIQDCVWYVDVSGGAGNGTSGSPFNSLAPLSTGGASDGLDGQGDIIFVYSGTLPSGIVLESGQQLLGQPHGLTVDGNTLVASGGTNPVIPGATIANDVDILAVSLTSTLSGSGTSVTVGGSSPDTVSINNTSGPAVNVSSTTGSLTFSSVSSSNSGGTGISLTSVDASFSATGGTITSATGTDVSISGGTGTFSYGGSITDTTGTLVSVSGATGGTKTFSGAITDSASGTGGGISLTSNTGATIDLTGGVNLSTGNSAAFTATGGGTVSVTGSANTITTLNGTGLNIANTTIGAGDVTFRSINVDGNDSAPTNGIVVNNTGNSGSLVVTGVSLAGSGGIVRDASGAGISLTSTLSPSLARMTITSNLGSGIAGSTITDATLSGLTVSSNGDDAGAEDGLLFQNLTGTATFTLIDAFGNARNNASVANTSGTLTSLQVVRSSFHGNQPTGSNGLAIIADGTSTMTVTMPASGPSEFYNNHTVGLLGQTLSAGTLTLNVQGAQSFADNFVGFELDHASSGNLTGTLNGADITNGGAGCSGNNSPCGAPVNLFLSSQASSSATSIMRATITNNTIDNGGSANAPGIWMHTGTPVVGHARLMLTGNNISNVNNRGILVEGGGCAGAQVCNATIDSTIRTNTISLGAGGLDGILINGGTNTADTIVFCADIGGSAAQSNNSSSGGGDGIRVRHRQSTTIGLPGYGGGQYLTADVVNYLTSRNSTTSDVKSATTSSSGGGFTNLTCQVP
jgi:hypothetical protein